VKLHENIEALK